MYTVQLALVIFLWSFNAVRQMSRHYHNYTTVTSCPSHNYGTATLYKKNVSGEKHTGK